MRSKCSKGKKHYIFVKYITKNGIRIYPKKAKAFRILVED